MKAVAEGRPVRTQTTTWTPAPHVARQIDDVVSAPGQALAAPVRAELEPRVGLDLRHVRVHAGPGAAEAAAAIGARAFTVGRHIVFGHGEHEPGSVAGRRLLLHELAHVAQHEPRSDRTGTTIGLMRSRTRERQADELADRVMRGQDGAREVRALRAGVLPAGSWLLRNGPPNASEQSVLGFVKGVLDEKGLPYSTEVKLRFTNIKGVKGSVNLRLDVVYHDGKLRPLEGKGADPSKLTRKQRLALRAIQENGADAEVLEVGGKPPGAPRARGAALAKGQTFKVAPGDLELVHGQYSGAPAETPTQPHGMRATTWQQAVEGKHPESVRTPDDVRFRAKSGEISYHPKGWQPTGKSQPQPPRTVSKIPERMMHPTKPPGTAKPVESPEPMVTEPAAPAPAVKAVPAEATGVGASEAEAGAVARSVAKPAAVVEGEAGVVAHSVAKPAAVAGGGAGAAARAAPAVEDAAIAGSTAGKLTSAAKAEAGAAAGTVELGALARGLRLGANVALMVAMYFLQKWNEDMEEAKVKADSAAIAKLVDARVAAMSDEVLDHQTANPGKGGFVRISVTTTTQIANMAMAGADIRYQGMKLNEPVRFAAGDEGVRESTVVTPPQTWTTEGGSVTYNDNIHTVTCSLPLQPLSHDELLKVLALRLAGAGPGERPEIQRRIDKIRALKGEALRREQKRKEERQKALIGEMEQPTPEPGPSKETFLPPPATPEPEPDPAGPLGALTPGASPVDAERKRVDYLFAKRDDLAAKREKLDVRDKDARESFKRERDEWWQRRSYLKKRLEQIDARTFDGEIRRLGALADWVKGNGRRLWEL